MSLKLTDVKVFASTNGKINIGYGTATFNEYLQVRFNIRKSKAGAEFVSWPQSSYQKDGETVYSNEVTISKDVSEEINEQIISEFNKVLAIGGSPAPKANDSASKTVDTKPKKTTKVKTNW